jgi:hypothetical protein|nr:hypothetical protein [uncultured Acetatifactor sp.]
MGDDVSNHFAVSGLWVTALDIFCPGVFSDGVSFGAIPAAVIDDGINGHFNSPDICWNCYKITPLYSPIILYQDYIRKIF